MQFESCDDHMPGTGNPLPAADAAVLASLPVLTASLGSLTSNRGTRGGAWGCGT
jgi:hypothetical protein